MIVCPATVLSRRSLLLVVLFLMSALSAASAADNAATRPSTRPATSKRAEERQRERLIAMRAATVAAYNYAKAHDQAIPTTEQLAKQMGVEPKDFQYRVVPSGSLAEHMKRVEGDWPEVLIAERFGGEDGKWAFGFVDGLCTIDSVESYRKMENSGALQAISEASTKPSSVR